RLQAFAEGRRMGWSTAVARSLRGSRRAGCAGRNPRSHSGKVRRAFRPAQPALRALLEAQILLLVVAVPLLSATVAHAACAGDCDGDGTVTIDELITGVNIVLALQPLESCLAWEEPDIANLIRGVINSLGGCAAQATATATEVGTASTPTNTPLTAATPTSVPTTTQFPVGASVAGRAALIASGLGSIGSVVSRVINAQDTERL